MQDSALTVTMRPLPSAHVVSIRARPSSVPSCGVTALFMYQIEGIMPEGCINEFA